MQGERDSRATRNGFPFLAIRLIAQAWGRRRGWGDQLNVIAAFGRSKWDSSEQRVAVIAKDYECLIHTAVPGYENAVVSCYRVVMGATVAGLP